MSAARDVTALAPARWWRGLGGLTRSGSSVEGLSWALYDFANTIFSFAIVSFAMGPWTTRALGEANGTLAFTVAGSLSVLLNAIVSPALGAVSDRTGRRKRYLLVFTVLCIVPTAVIGFVNIWLGLLAFAIANFAFQAALIYYDAILPDVAKPEKRGRLSGIGVGLGYMGTIVSGLLLRYTTDDEGLITAASFVLVASLFAIFAIPIFLVVKERPITGAIPFRLADALRSWRQLGVTWQHAGEQPGLRRFIVGRFFYSDGVNTAIAVMSLFTINAIGFTEGEALYVLLGLTVVAVIASFGWGYLADRWGPKRTLLIVLGSWVLGLLIMGLVTTKPAFLVAGAILGSGLGGTAVTDRLLLLRLAPPERVGEMFGLFGLAGKFSAVIGPVVFGVIIFLLVDSLGTVAYQVAILSLLGLMVLGYWIVRGVPEPPPEAGDAAQAALAGSPPSP
ncbi:MAG TPA: MFS transporter [Candidatus Limnocylindria bacterium]|nr:MFS transporter [Candidatus Limnocylindria bacterium]